MPNKGFNHMRVGRRRKSPVKPGTEEETLRTLWKANIQVGGRKDSFLFRCTEEFERAAFTAEVLLQSSPAATMVGAVITGIERQAKLWN